MLVASMNSVKTEIVAELSLTLFEVCLCTNCYAVYTLNSIATKPSDLDLWADRPWNRNL